MQSNKLATTLTLATAAIFYLASPANAGGLEGEATITIKPSAVALSAGDYIPSGTNPSSVPDPNCEWQLALEDDFERAVFTTGRQGPNTFELYDTDASMNQGDKIQLGDHTSEFFILNSNRAFSETGRWWYKLCNKPDTDIFDFGINVPEGEAVTIPELFIKAISAIEPGEPPVRTDPQGATKLVQAPVIFSIDNDYWTTRTNTINAGRISVTANLIPTRSIWNTGDPQTQPLICNGPGTPFQSTTNYTQYPCQHRYTQATPPGGTYDLQTRAVFNVTGSTNAPEIMGPYPTLETQTNTQIEVAEIQVVSKPTRK